MDDLFVDVPRPTGVREMEMLAQTPIGQASLLGLADRAATRLDSNRYRDREQAERQLRQIGLPALELLDERVQNRPGTHITEVMNRITRDVIARQDVNTLFRLADSNHPNISERAANELIRTALQSSGPMQTFHNSYTELLTGSGRNLPMERRAAAMCALADWADRQAANPRRRLTIDEMDRIAEKFPKLSELAHLRDPEKIQIDLQRQLLELRWLPETSGRAHAAAAILTLEAGGANARECGINHLLTALGKHKMGTNLEFDILVAAAVGRHNLLADNRVVTFLKQRGYLETVSKLNPMADEKWRAFCTPHNR